ncbi:ferrous iron transport protein B [Caldicellulosiruptoraceae bacterium PP1]
MSCHCSTEITNIPKDKEWIALVGNPNVGKSVVFNRLTGKYVEVSNFPGTTVDINFGYLDNYILIDTPGVYGISSFNDEEIVTRNIVLNVNKVLNVVDAMHLDRDLFLTQQLIDLGKEVIVILNMMDEVEKNKVSIDIDKLKSQLGVEVIPVSANKNRGMDLIKKSLSKFRKGIRNQSLNKYMLQEDKLIEFLIDNEVFCENFSSIQEELYSYRRQYIDNIISNIVRYDEKNEKLKRKLSEILLNPITGYPILLISIYILYYLMGVVVAQKVVDFTMNRIMNDQYGTFIHNLLNGFISNKQINKLLIGNFGLLTMFPIIFFGLLLPLVTAFHLFLGLLEDSGYLPRIAALIDKFLNKIGLNGRAIIPIILGFGCVTMATVTTRILGSKRERFIAVFLLGLTIPCSAQLGIITGLIAKMGFWYFIAFVAIILLIFGIAGKILNKVTPGSSTDLFIDLPPMRIPVAKNVLKKTYFKTKGFLYEAFPIFVIGTLFLGVLDAFNLLKTIENFAKPLISGFLKLPPQMAEVFILGIIRRDYGAAGLVTIPTTKPQMFVALVTTTLFVPCISSFVMMIKENGFKNALSVWVSSAVIAILVGGFIANVIF